MLYAKVCQKRGEGSPPMSKTQTEAHLDVLFRSSRHPRMRLRITPFRCLEGSMPACAGMTECGGQDMRCPDRSIPGINPGMTALVGDWETQLFQPPPSAL